MTNKTTNREFVNKFAGGGHYGYVLSPEEGNNESD